MAISRSISRTEQYDPCGEQRSTGDVSAQRNGSLSLGGVQSRIQICRRRGLWCSIRALRLHLLCAWLLLKVAVKGIEVSGRQRVEHTARSADRDAGGDDGPQTSMPL